MKILLAACNAKYIHSNLAVYNLMAYAKDYSEHLILKEYTINQTKDDILRDIYLSEPDVVCFSCYIWNISFVKDIIGDLAKILPGVPFWAGGPEVSFDASKFLEENPQFTGVMMGEGEATFKELVKYYVEKEGDLKQIAGITYRENNEIHVNPWREILDLSTVPFAYENLADFKNRIIYYETIETDGKAELVQEDDINGLCRYEVTHASWVIKTVQQEGGYIRVLYTTDNPEEIMNLPKN